MSKFEKSANKLVLNLNSIIKKPEPVEERVPPPNSPIGLTANSTAVAKVAEDVAASTTYSHSPLIPASNPLPVPSNGPAKQRATKPKATASRPRKPQPSKKKAAPPLEREADQLYHDELALSAAPSPVPAASTRKPKHTTSTAKANPPPTKVRGHAKPVGDGAIEMQPVATKKSHAKPSRARKHAEVDVSSQRGLSSDPSPPALKQPPKPKKKEPETVRPMYVQSPALNGNSLRQRPFLEGDVEKSATEAPSTRTQKRKTRAEELPAEMYNFLPIYCILWSYVNKPLGLGPKLRVEWRRTSRESYVLRRWEKMTEMRTKRYRVLQKGKDVVSSSTKWVAFSLAPPRAYFPSAMHLGRRGPRTSARSEVAWPQMSVSAAAKERDPIAPPPSDTSRPRSRPIHSKKNLESLQCTILIIPSAFSTRLSSPDEKEAVHTLRRRAP